MKRFKTDTMVGRRLKMSHTVLGLGVLYLILISLKFPLFLEMVSMLSGENSFVGLDGSSRDLDRDKRFVNSVYQDVFHRNLEDTQTKNVPEMPRKHSLREFSVVSHTITPVSNLYGRLIEDVTWRKNVTTGLSELEKMAIEAWTLGLKAWEQLGNDDFPGTDESDVIERKPESCPSSIALTGEEMTRLGHIMFLPCGLAAGSSITVVGTPEKAHEEYVPQLTKFKDGNPIVFVSQFTIELQGLKVVDGEDPPKILHLNPRLQGDWSQVPVIEHNTCYRMQWGTAQRCDGLPSRNEDDTVDGFGKCEKWIRSGIVDSKESKTSSWLKRFIGRAKKPEMTWPFPFMEERLFVLTIRAGMEGYHIIVGGRHISSFPYRTGFSLEEATGLSINGNVRVHSIYGTGLPISHPSFSLQQVLEMSETWKTPPLPTSPIDLFIGILSAANHFAERMAIRKTWMQFPAIRSSNIVARFFVALNPRNKVNALLKKEADYFGDIVILPFMDHYELVVLKTLAICEYGVQNVTAAYIMKCDDDTFVRVETVLKEIKSVSGKKPLYMGNLNFLHRPLRSGKWAVTYEEWPEAIYPPYANGPGYIISVDIARFIISQRGNQSLRLFKMEDVSMGLWVEQFNISTSVQYSHNWKFCQYGCMEDYYTAHYQSPRQMICLWDKLARGHAHCCNLR